MTLVRKLINVQAWATEKCKNCALAHYKPSYIVCDPTLHNVDSAVIASTGPDGAKTPALADTAAKPTIENTPPAAMMILSKNLKPG